jgi:hypothetical protein
MLRVFTGKGDVEERCGPVEAGIAKSLRGAYMLNGVSGAQKCTEDDNRKTEMPSHRLAN